MLQFLHTYFLRGLGYSTICTAKSALSACVVLKSGQPLGQHLDVQMYLKGVFNKKPPNAHKKIIWDPEDVLNWIKSQDGLELCPIDFLARRLALLILLVTGQRPQVLVALKLGRMMRLKEMVTFKLTSQDL